MNLFNNQVKQVSEQIRNYPNESFIMQYRLKNVEKSGASKLSALEIAT